MATAEDGARIRVTGRDIFVARNAVLRAQRALEASEEGTAEHNETSNKLEEAKHKMMSLHVRADDVALDEYERLKEVGPARRVPGKDSGVHTASPGRVPGRSSMREGPGEDWKVPAFASGLDARRMAAYRLAELEEDATMPQRQRQAVTLLLQKVLASGISEVGMSRAELADATGMPQASAQTALDALASRADWFTRSDSPRAMVNQQAQLRRRRKGYRPRYFYRLVDVVTPPRWASLDASGLASLMTSQEGF